MNKKQVIPDKPYLTYNKDTDSFTFLPDEDLFAYFKHDELLDLSVAEYYIFTQVLKNTDLSLKDKEKIISLAEQITIKSCYLEKIKKSNEIRYVYPELLSQFKKANPTLVKLIEPSKANRKPKQISIESYIGYSLKIVIGDRYVKESAKTATEAWTNMFSTKQIITKEEKVNILCHAFVIHFLFQMYMLHIWLKPKFRIGFHKKVLALKGKILWINKY